MRIEELPLPNQVKDIILQSGISVLYPPQEDAIKAGALEGKNLVLASPTASGKTLVAELCSMKHVIEHGGKVLYMTPLRALASEKYEEFNKYTKLLKDENRYVRVAISTGDYDNADYRLGSYDVIIVTNEKCDSLLRHQADWVKSVTLVVADEIHILNNKDRGPTLEVTLTRLMEINPNIQLLALSATINNSDEIAKWLKARSITTEWRPVNLKEGVYLEDECQFNDGSAIKVNEEKRNNPVINLVIHELKKRGQILIFANTRRSAVSYARRTAPSVKKYLSNSEKRQLKAIAKRILSTGEKTRISDILAELTKNGVAFHHAGLSCLPTGTLIMLWNGGKKKIEDVKPGEEVLSLNQRTIQLDKGRVLSTWQSGVRDIFTLKSTSGKQIMASGNHPFLSIKNGELSWIPLDQLEIGKYIATPRINRHTTVRGKETNNNIYPNHNRILSEQSISSLNFRDIYWDKIEDIAECGEADVWDLQVDKQNFVAEDIIVHNSAQRKIVEESFKKRNLKVISATPTLAAGVNLPARMVVISSYERYEVGYGRFPISVLEFKQMAGRAGRPQYDDTGEAILISKTSDEQDYLMQSYIFAKPERLWSKLAVESLLRSHVLASIASGFTYSDQGLFEFFDKTFYAHQYGSHLIRTLVGKILLFLNKEGMVTFMGKTLEATDFGHRVSELYLDPVSAVILREGLNSRPPILTELSLFHLVCHTPDMYPKYYPKRREVDELSLYVDLHSEEFMFPIPHEAENVDFETFLGEVKRACILEAWIDETSEDEIIGKYSFQPGDLFRLISRTDWLLYASSELAKIFTHRDLLPVISNLRMRVVKGVKSELLPLIKLESVGRVRGRILFNAGFKTLTNLKQVPLSQLVSLPLIGFGVAEKIKAQVGGLIKDEEWKKLKEMREREQKSLFEY
jgi:replicative superfamily II helicase